MKSERWQKIETLYHAALEQEPRKRPAFLRKVCGEDVELRREIESLLDYDAKAQEFIEAPALEVAAKQLAEAQADVARKRRVSGYEILSPIGSGGMGEVYLARDLRLQRRVAIKFLPLLASDNQQARKRFLREARLAAQLDHPNICTIHEVREEDGASFIVMQYIEGETLAHRIRRKPLALGDALDIAIQIADALAEAHSHAIIHRDIKPQNIIINSRKQVKVLDFGLAKRVKTGSQAESGADLHSIISTPGLIVGTAPYMSPEQVRGKDLDARTDIFSFGAVIYEMLSGRSPFAASSRLESLVAITSENPLPLTHYDENVPAELQRIVSKALRKEPDERYQSIKDVLLDLQTLRTELARDLALDRSNRPEPGDVNEIDAVKEPATLIIGTAITKDAAAPLTVATTAPSTSNVDSVVQQISHRRLTMLLVLGLLLAAIAFGCWFFVLR